MVPMFDMLLSCGGSRPHPRHLPSSLSKSMQRWEPLLRLVKVQRWTDVARFMTLALWYLHLLHSEILIIGRAKVQRNLRQIFFLLYHIQLSPTPWPFISFHDTVASEGPLNHWRLHHNILMHRLQRLRIIIMPWLWHRGSVVLQIPNEKQNNTLVIDDQPNAILVLPLPFLC